MTLYPVELNEIFFKNLPENLCNVYKMKYQIMERGSNSFSSNIRRLYGRRRVIGANYFGIVESKQKSRFLGHCEWFTVVVMGFRLGAKRVKVWGNTFTPKTYYKMLEQSASRNKNNPITWRDVIDADASLYYEQYEDYFDSWEGDNPSPILAFHNMEDWLSWRQVEDE